MRPRTRVVAVVDDRDQVRRSGLGQRLTGSAFGNQTGNVIGNRWEPRQGDPGPASIRDTSALVTPNAAAASASPKRAPPVGSVRVWFPAPSLGRPAGGALGRVESLPGVGIPTREQCGEVVPLDGAPQHGGLGTGTEPSAGLLTAVGVVPGRTFGASGPGPDRRPGGRRLQVADDPVDDPGEIAPGAAQRCDGEPHWAARSGRPAGFPKGNLQVCARRILPSATTIAWRGAMLPGRRGRRRRVIDRGPGRGRGRVRWGAGGGRGAP